MEMGPPPGLVVRSSWILMLNWRLLVQKLEVRVRARERARWAWLVFIVRLVSHGPMMSWIRVARTLRRFARMRRVWSSLGGRLKSFKLLEGKNKGKTQGKNK